MTTPNVNAVALKLPPFWVPYPAAWFLTIEAQFSTRGITQEKTKYEYVLQSLPMDVVSSVFDIITSVQDSETPYTEIKKILIERNSMSESKRLEQLLSGEEIGDRKPSDFYRHLKNLAGSSTAITEDLIKELWLRRLSSIVSALVKSSGKTKINELLEVADSVHETLQQQQHKNFSVNAVSSSPSTASSSNNLQIFELKMQNQHQQLQSEISEIRNMLSRMNFGNNNNNHNHNRSNSRHRGRSKSRNRENSRLCYYHHRFGNKANKCVPPCNFSDSPK